MRQPDNKKEYLAQLETKEYKDLPQKDQVLKYLAKHGSITTGEASAELGIMRLSARIEELRADCWPISTEPLTGTNRFGHATRYANYRMTV